MPSWTADRDRVAPRHVGERAVLPEQSTLRVIDLSNEQPTSCALVRGYRANLTAWMNEANASIERFLSELDLGAHRDGSE